MSIMIRYLETGEIILGQNYVRQLWSTNHILANDAKLFEWQYRSPVENDSRLGFLIAEDDGQPVGCIGRMPVRCHIHGQPVPGAAIALLVADPAYRHNAIGLELLKQAYQGLEIIITQGINEHVAKLYRMLRQEVVPAMPRYVCRGHMDALYAMWEAANSSLPFPQEAYRVIPMAHPIHVRKDWQLETLTEENLEEWDNCWKNDFAPSRQGSTKDAWALRWRYLDHPTFQYEAFLAKNSRKQIGGLIVLRRIPLLGDIQAIRIMEFLCKNEEASQTLAAGIMERFTSNTAFIEFVCLGQDWHALRLQLGLSELGNDLFSVCFNPLDFTRCKIMASFASKVPNLSPKSLVTSPSTYITIADGDQDRPN